MSDAKLPDTDSPFAHNAPASPVSVIGSVREHGMVGGFDAASSSLMTVGIAPIDSLPIDDIVFTHVELAVTRLAA